MRLETGDVFSMDLSGAYDVIVVTGALPVYDERFEKALAVGGRLFVVVGEAPTREAMRVIAGGKGVYSREVLFETDIPPLRNAPTPDRFVF